MQSGRATIGGVLVALVLSGAFVLSQSAHAQITFLSTRDGRGEIYVMDMDGSNQRRLTNNAIDETVLAWSPDGRYIVFDGIAHGTKDGAIDGQRDIYVMDADGDNVRKLTDTPVQDMAPSWSPKGLYIAFAAGDGEQCDIYVMDADGGNPTNLTKSESFNTSPSWSPDGRQIAFLSDRDGNYEIFVMDADGRAQRNLTQDSSHDTGPSWSPDGRQIAYSSVRGEVDSDIYVMDADGGRATRLTDHRASDRSPSWSSDGRHIVFASNRHGWANSEIYIMDADGANQRNLTNHDAGDLYPACIHPVLAVSPAGRSALTWGWIKQIGS